MSALTLLMPPCADAVRAFDWRQAHDIDVDTQLGQLHRRRQARQPAADHHHALLCHYLLFLRHRNLTGFHLLKLPHSVFRHDSFLYVHIAESDQGGDAD